jgi:hypothetical protein
MIRNGFILGATARVITFYKARNNNLSITVRATDLGTDSPDVNRNGLTAQATVERAFFPTFALSKFQGYSGSRKFFGILA